MLKSLDHTKRESEGDQAVKNTSSITVLKVRLR